VVGADWRTSRPKDGKMELGNPHRSTLEWEKMTHV